MVSAASGISSVLSSRQASAEGKLDAAVEFLSLRNSPLDDLTEKLSQMSASRQRSVARSWERAPNNRPRVSLLNGDPFRQDPSSPPCSSPTPVIDTTRVHADSAQVSAVQNVTLAVVDLVISSPVQDTAVHLQFSAPSPTSLPSTPPAYISDLSSPRRPLDHRSPAKSGNTPVSALRRKPIPTVTVTPKVKVYNDAQPPNTQPQTPADVGASTRRRRGRSDTGAQPAASGIRRGVMGSPPTIPKRHPHRNTYPSTTPQQAAQATPINALPTPIPITGVESARRDFIRRRAGTQRSSLESENDVEGHVQDLEQDRRTWMGRREAGTLDTTPPAEGRFERYLL
ncbi:hypothetical protein LTR08_006369 [Meristemomyces frigidus]|nr:hypothetical protein LTR08_006369 [Meristemomyces frigidus]